VPVIASNNFLEDLAFVLSVAALISVIFQALRQPVVVGYLVAGMLIGPHVPFPLFADSGRIHILSELGVILLMFALGLEFSVRRLARLAPTAGFITVVQVGLLMTLGYEVGRAFGWSELEGIFTGAIVAISSTTIVAKAFAEEKVDQGLSELVFGVTLFEDLAAVIILAVLTAIATGAGLSVRMIAVTVGQLVFFLAALIGAGLLIVPRAIRLAARFERNETLTVASVGICFAVAMIADLAGYSVALGAFLAGVLVAESGHAPQIEHLVAPLRDIFGAIFFVSVGMMLDPRVLADHWPELIVLVTIVLVGKIIGVGVGAMLSGASTRSAVQAGMAMAQIGEFSFIIAGTGLEHGATHKFLYSLAIAVSAITTFTTPFMIRASDRVGRIIDTHLPRSVGILQSIYDSWAEQMRARPHPRDYRGAIAFIVLAMGAVVAVAITYAIFADRLHAMIVALTGLSTGTATILIKAAALGLAAVPCVAIWRGAHRLARRIASNVSAAPGPSAVGTETDPTGSNLLAGICEIAIIFGAVTVLLAIIGPFMCVIDGVAVMLIAMSGLAIMIWRSARHLYSLVHEASGALVARIDSLRENSPGSSSAGDAGLSSGGIGPLTQVQIPEGSAAIGMSLSDLNLHAATGAMVMAIVRDSRSVTLPGGSEVLRAGDAIALAGPSDAVAAACELLAVPADAALAPRPAIQ
jgi:monovalent cation:H+ antiporter-2, CPA2 family